MSVGQGISIRAYARRRGVRHSAVQKAIRIGRIRAAVLPDGSINADLADRLWAANVDETKPLNSVSGSPKHRRDPSGISTPVGSAAVDRGADEISPGIGYVAARARREDYAARLARMEYLERRGKLVRADEVKRAVFDAFRIVRDRLQALPDIVDGRLVGRTRHEINAILREQIDETLRSLADAARRSAELADAKQAPGGSGARD